MKMWCDRHSSYYDIQDWACPKCLVGDYTFDGFRERLIDRLLSELPNEDDEELWNSREKIEDIIRSSLEQVSSIQKIYNCMFYYDHERKILDVSLVRSIESIKLALTVST